jgi:hypothetical protein
MPPPPTLISDPIIPAKNEIIVKLRSTLQHFLDHDMTFQQFLTNREVRLAWWTLARVYRITYPIELLAVAKKNSSDSNNAAAVMMHWLFLCSCGHGASIGLVNKGPRLCLSCQKKKKKQSTQNNPLV